MTKALAAIVICLLLGGGVAPVIADDGDGDGAGDIVDEDEHVKRILIGAQTYLRPQSG